MARSRDTRAAAEDDVADEAAAVEDQVAEEQSAADKRAAQAEAALELKASPKGEEVPPTQKKVSGEAAYSQQRLIDESEAFLGYPSFVVAGAMYGNDKEYLTINQALKRVEDWLQAPVVGAQAES